MVRRICMSLLLVAAVSVVMSQNAERSKPEKIVFHMSLKNASVVEEKGAVRVRVTKTGRELLAGSQDTLERKQSTRAARKTAEKALKGKAE